MASKDTTDVFSVPSLTDLTNLASHLQIPSDEVRLWISEQQAYYRDQRAQIRNSMLQEKELELKRLQLISTERSEVVQREKEEADIKMQFEMRKAEMEHELKLAELRVVNHDDDNRHSSIPLPISQANSLKLPFYRDGEDITDYLIRFERIAEMVNVPDHQYSIHLGSLLSGRALKIYTSLPAGLTSDYSRLKEALLLGFNKSSDSYRNDFKSMKIGSDETYDQFAAQMTKIFDLWLESNHVEQDYQKLKEFILCDQFLSSLQSDLRTFIKENKVSGMVDMIELADRWSTAHKAYPKASNFKSRQAGVKFTRPSEVVNQHCPDSRVEQAFNSKKDWSKLKCYNCGELGHPQFLCKRNNLRNSRRETVNCCQNDKFGVKEGSKEFQKHRETVSFCFSDCSPRNYFSTGTVNGMNVSTVWRDTGCSCVIVANDVLPNIIPEDHEQTAVYDYLGNCQNYPLVMCYLKCPFYCGWVKAVRAPLKFCSVLVGNVPGVKDDCSNVYTDNSAESVLSCEEKQNSNVIVSVATRSSKFKAVHPLKVPSFDMVKLTREEFIRLQRTCPTIKDIRSMVKSGKVTIFNSRSFKFVEMNDLVYHKCIKSKVQNEINKLTLVIPSDCRNSVLKVAHESTLSGHFSNRKTEQKIRDQFYWPRMGTDIKLFCRSCDLCQRCSSKGRVKKVPMVKMPIISEPFYRVSIDLVGPLQPVSSGGHRYVLTLIDCATSFPEAIPLKNIDTISVSEALLEIFARVGIPKEIHSDLGKQFTSDLMRELHRLLGIHPVFNTPYHPMGTGRIERIHSTLKSILKKLCIKNPTEWHRYITPTLFALREMPSDRTGYSAFELLYGRQVRGPVSVLRDIWENKNLSRDDRTVYQYVLDLQNKLEETALLAAETAKISSSKYKQYFDLKTQNRYFEVGNEVLVLLPDVHNKLLMSWRGPFKVLERRNKVNYLIDENGSERLYHTNILKLYHRRSEVKPSSIDNFSNVACTATPFVVHNCVLKDVYMGNEVLDEIISIEEFKTSTSEFRFGNDISDTLKANIGNTISDFSDVFSDVPGCTDTVVHEIKLCSKTPVKCKMYKVPVHLKQHFDDEVDKLLELGIIKPSSSPFCSPCVMIEKSDKTYRLAIDFRELNAITEFDAEPPCDLESELHKFSDAKFFSELDLCKAYYQIKLNLNSMHLTAFATSKGLMEFTRMPFGLVTACASYIRLMRSVLDNLNGVSFYFDNILIYSKTEEEHVQILRNVLIRLKLHHLTLKPSKCSFGNTQVDYLGFKIGGGEIQPLLDKLSAISEMPVPKTKTMLRSFMGLCQFYAKFVKNFAEIASPMTDKLKKYVREPLVWTELDCQSFNELKNALVNHPVLKLPDLTKPFVVRTDASLRGIGGILLQYHDNVPHPVAYASRKLLPREQRFSTIERELLAVIFTLSKFKYHLLGKQFILEVDHRPLVYLKKFKGDNDRLMRWALTLQSYDFRIVYIPGPENVGADILSRLY